MGDRRTSRKEISVTTTSVISISKILLTINRLVALLICPPPNTKNAAWLVLPNHAAYHKPDLLFAPLRKAAIYPKSQLFSVLTVLRGGLPDDLLKGRGKLVGIFIAEFP